MSGDNLDARGGNSSELPKAPSIWSFSGKGRYGRLNYIDALLFISVTTFITLAIVIIAGYFAEYKDEKLLPFIIAISLIGAVFIVRATVLRLHDINLKGLFVLLPLGSVALTFCSAQLRFIAAALFFALVAALCFLTLTAIPGAKRPNRYGEQRKRGTYTGLIIFILALGMAPLIIALRYH